MSYIDLTGKTFGFWTIIGKFSNQRQAGTVWRCRCRCGTERVVESYSLRHGLSKSCGCESEFGKRRRFPDLSGEIFANWTVIDHAEIPGHHNMWKCRCKCGTERNVLGSNLTSGRSKSCGCVTGRKSVYDFAPGTTFGKLRIIEKIGSKYLCKCACGNQTVVSGSPLAHGRTQSCGCGMREVMFHRHGQGHHNWKGGRTRTKHGYIRLRMPEHPNANKVGDVFEHIYIMSQKLGRPLRKGETVHHINGIRDDNRPENLELWNKAHGPGQRVSDKIAWAKQLLAEYCGVKELRRWVRTLENQSSLAEDNSARETGLFVTA